jgi:internalin A
MELRRVAAFLSDYPNVRLRVYSGTSRKFDSTYTTLGFLEYFSEVRRVWLDIFELEDLSGLRFLRPDLEQLGLGQTTKRLSLRPLEHFGALRDLYLCGHSKEFQVIGELRSLRRLSLRSITLPDLSALRELTELEEFELKLGATRDLRLLPEIGRLRYFEAWQVRGLANLEPLAGVRSLRSLFLESLKNVTALPSLAPLTELTRIHLQNLKGLHDLVPVAAAPTLKDLVVVQMGHLEPEAFRPFVGHPTLRAASIGLSEQKAATVDALLRLPLVNYRTLLHGTRFW